MFRLIGLVLLLFGACVWAEEEVPAGLMPLPELPEIPPPVESGENMAPDITIIRKQNETIEEYRINNRLYKVKIKPVVGPAYYLIDTDGDGNMDVRRSDADRDMSVPQWVLFSW